MADYSTSPAFSSPAYWIALGAGVLGVGAAAWQESRQGSAALSPTRLAELESTKHRLRSMVFEEGDSPRGEKAGKALRAVRERLIEDAAPARAQAERRSAMTRKAEGAYLKVALGGTTLRGDEKAVHEQAFELAGGHDRGFRLRDLYERTVEQAERSAWEDKETTAKRLLKRFALQARRDGYSASAVAAFVFIVNQKSRR